MTVYPLTRPQQPTAAPLAPMSTWLRWLFVALVFAAFLTQVKLIPTIRNNVGPFEILGVLVIATVFLSPRISRPLLYPPTVRITLGILAIGALSLLNIEPNRLGVGLLNVGILAFLAFFLVAAYNLIHQHRVSPGKLLEVVCLALLVVGPWIIAGGLSSDGDIQEAGPFRNRAHMASYMLTAFWMALMHAQWPGIGLRRKLIAYAGVLMSLYAVAASGRRSVYLSLAVGLAVLASAFLAARRGTKMRFAAVLLVVVTAVGAMYTFGPRYFPQLAFFKSRVGLIDDRLESALGVSKDEAEERGFFALQREGVRLAFEEHPLIGIGWGGFAKSRFSPTGHEVHSTPLRFIAETGLVGAALYMALMLSLAWSVLRSLILARGSPYYNAFLVLAVGFFSLLASYLYNRHVTERTFWLLMLVIFASELFAMRVQSARLPAAPLARR